MMIEEITINQFIKMWFKDSPSEEFEKIYSEYLDLSGLFVSRQFDLLAYIYRLSNRITSIKMSLCIQREMIDVFGEPYEPGLSFFEKYHHKVYWNGDRKQFLDYLIKIESKESRFEKELAKKQKEFSESQKTKKQPKTITQTRHDFITMLNTLSKNGYKIDRDKTTVEELALMIKETQDNAAKPS